MFFKKDKNEKKDVKKDFVQAKLSVSAVESYLLRLAERDADITNDKLDWQFYTLQSGQTIKYLTSTASIYHNLKLEYLYLLAQTAPYHIPNRLSFPLKYMAYIVNETDGKLVPWSTNSKLISAFVKVGSDNGVIFLLKTGEGGMTVGLCPSLIPVTHKEGMSMSEEDFFDPFREVAEYSPELIAKIKAIDSHSFSSSGSFGLISNNYSAWTKLATKEQKAACREASFLRYS